MPNLALSFRLSDLSQLKAFAEGLAARLRPGDSLLLDGDLGAGKTTFIKDLCQALGSSDVVTSPTYTIAQLYQSRLGPLVHIDAYRLSQGAEIWDLGYEEQMEEGLTFIEWGQRVCGDFPEALRIEFVILSDRERQANITASQADWADRLADLEIV